MGYSSLLKSPKKEEEQQVPNSIWDDSQPFFELSDEEKQPQLDYSIVYGSPLDYWDLIDHYLDDDHFSFSATIPNHGGEEAEAFGRVVPKACSSDSDDVMKKKKVSLNLNLNYEEVLEAWSGRGSLWAAGSSRSDPNNGVYMGEVPRMELEEERSRRMLRYKKKRHTRLFSNKIRYQVRKLNADKRPRIKGRFVKTVS